MIKESKMLSLLGAAAPDQTQVRELMLFGQFAGSWDIDATLIEDELENRTTGEWHFDWILERKALQDVLIFPASATPDERNSPDHRIGTSLRFYDFVAKTWRVVWVNPSSGTMYKLTGGKIEDEIVLVGDPHDGEPTRWIFSEITDSYFLWRGVVSKDNGKGWQLIQEMRATRRK